MKWRHLPKGVIMRNADTGEILDLSHMEQWWASHGQFGYVISIDHKHPELGYRASAKPLGSMPDFTSASPRQDLIEGARNWTEAEAACKAHARGRRDS